LREREQARRKNNVFTAVYGCVSRGFFSEENKSVSRTGMAQSRDFAEKKTVSRIAPENGIKKERETGLEPATPTLARSYSTN
jgi:hypothetical protein